MSILNEITERVCQTSTSGFHNVEIKSNIVAIEKSNNSNRDIWDETFGKENQ